MEVKYINLNFLVLSIEIELINDEISSILVGVVWPCLNTKAI